MLFEAGKILVNTGDRFRHSKRSFHQKSIVILFISFCFCLNTVLNAQTLSYSKNNNAMQSISLPGNIELNYYEKGNSGTCILFLHGLGSSHKAFLKMIPLLEDDFRCLAIDYPKDLDHFSLKGYASIIHEFMKAKSIEKYQVVGHSMGAQIAMHLVLMYPEEVEGLILLAPAGIEEFSKEDKSWFANYVTKSYYKTFTPEKVKYNFNINFFGGMPSDADFMYEERIEIMSDSLSYDRYLDYYLGCVNAMLAEPVFESIPQIQTKALILYGADDFLIPNRILHSDKSVSDMLEKALNQFQYAEGTLINECGHFMPWDQAESICIKIEKFINQ